MKVSVIGVILVRAFQHSESIRTRTTPNIDILYAVFRTTLSGYLFTPGSSFIGKTNKN